MGASASSTRRLTVQNDNPRIIQVTEEVVNRLRSAGPPPPTASATLFTPNLQPSDSSSDLQNENVDPSLQSSPAVVGSVHRNVQNAAILNVGRDGHPIIETVSAYQVRQEKEEEMRQNDRFWVTKLRELETRYATSAFASQEEFGSKLEKLQTFVPRKRDKPCETLTAKVAECYASNPSQPLRCSEEVRSFANCVDGVRAA